MIVRSFFLWFLMFLPSGVTPAPLAPVDSSLYGSALLPCKFTFVDSQAGLTLIWVKKENQGEVVVFKLQNGREKPEDQDPRYRGRVTLSRGISHGNVDLILRDVTHKDGGTYECRAGNLKKNGNQEVTLTVNRLNAAEATATLVTTDGQRRLKCRGSGVYRNPEVKWITAGGDDLSTYGTRSITDQSNGWKLVESVLDYDLEANVQVLCHITEGGLRRSTRAVISDGSHVVVVQNTTEL